MGCAGQGADSPRAPPVLMSLLWSHSRSFFHVDSVQPPVLRPSSEHWEHKNHLPIENPGSKRGESPILGQFLSHRFRCMGRVLGDPCRNKSQRIAAPEAIPDLLAAPH